MSNTDDVQADVHDAIVSVTQALDALACAEDCESAEDLRANLKEAIAALQAKSRKLRESVKSESP